MGSSKELSEHESAVQQQNTNGEPSAVTVPSQPVQHEEQLTAVEKESNHEILNTTGEEWKHKPQADKTTADEFDEYFAGLFP